MSGLPSYGAGQWPARPAPPPPAQAPYLSRIVHGVGIVFTDHICDPRNQPLLYQAQLYGARRVFYLPFTASGEAIDRLQQPDPTEGEPRP